MLDLLRDMLPQGNEIPKNTYEAKQNVCPLGLEVEKIHACSNDCILYRGDYADLTECPECSTPRYKRRNDGGDEKRRHGASKGGMVFPSNSSHKVFVCIKQGCTAIAMAQGGPQAR